MLYHAELTVADHKYTAQAKTVAKAVQQLVPVLRSQLLAYQYAGKLCLHHCRFWLTVTQGNKEVERFGITDSAVWNSFQAEAYGLWLLSYGLLGSDAA